MAQVTGREGTTITIQTTIDISGSMLDLEEAILASVNEVGAIATQEGLKRFDADGAPIVVGGIKWYSRSLEGKAYQTPYGEVSVREPGGIFQFSRDITARGVLRYMVHPKNNGYHLTHHLLPTVPYYHLPAAHQVLLKLSVFQQHACICTSYLFGQQAVVRA